MSDGATGGAVPGAATGEELAAMRAEYARALPWIAAPWDEYFPLLFATLDALTGALAEAERARAADAAVLAALVEDPWVGFHADSLEEHYCCFYCTAAVSIGNDAAPTVLPDHDADCPIARARGLLDARRAATTTEEDAGDAPDH